MNEELEQQQANILSASPVSNAANVKKPKITRQQELMTDVLYGEGNTAPVPTDMVDSGTVSTPSDVVDEATVEAQTRVLPRSATPRGTSTLASGGKLYSGTDLYGYDTDPYWTSYINRFTPVNTWTVDIPILKHGVSTNTTDPEELAAQIAMNYQGIPQDNFIGYEFAPHEEFTESLGSAFISGVAEGFDRMIVDGAWAVAGWVNPGKYGYQNAEERAAISRNSDLLGWAQEYLDKVEASPELKRTRLGDIVYGAGSVVAQMSPMLIPYVGWTARGAMSAALGAGETLSTRDKVLELGGTPEEARWKSLAHFGTIGVTDMLTGGVTSGIQKMVVGAALRRGARKSATKIASTISAGVGGSAIDAVTENVQDKLGNIISGAEGWGQFLYWDRQNWNTFYSTLIVGALRLPAAYSEGGKAYEKKGKQDAAKNEYIGLVANLKDGLRKDAEKRGVNVPDAVWKSIDDMAMRIWENPEAEVKPNIEQIVQEMTHVAVTNPAVAERAQAFVDSGRGKELSEEAMAAFDKRVEETVIEPYKEKLTEREKEVIRGSMRGMAYIGAYFFGQNPSDIKIPTLGTNVGRTSGGNFRFNIAQALFGKQDGGEVNLRLNARQRAALAGQQVISPYDILTGKHEIFYVVNNILHEFSHANDWNMQGQIPINIAEFVDWYMGAIEDVFGQPEGRIDEKRGELIDKVKSSVKTNAEKGSLSYDGKNYNGNGYTRPENTTEWRAQAIGRLGKRAANYIGLRGLPADYVQAVNAILYGMQETAPQTQALTEYINAMRENVKKNSDVIKGIAGKNTTNQMRAIVSKYMGDGSAIEWFGQDASTLKSFASALQSPLDAQALDYVNKVFDGLDFGPKDFVDRAQQDFDLAWSDEPIGVPDTSEQTNKNRTEQPDGGNVDTSDGIEDWSGPNVESNELAEAANVVNSVKGKEQTPFQKMIDHKFNNKSIMDSLRDAKNFIMKHKFVKFGFQLDSMRGIHAFLTALGGKEFEREYNLIGRYDDYGNRVIAYQKKLVDRLVNKLFGGSFAAYQDYVRAASVKKYTITYNNPLNGFKPEQRTYSKRELMYRLLMEEQEDSRERAAKTTDINEVKKYLDDTDIAFAYAHRDYLAADFKRVSGGKKAIKNYFPIMDAKEYEKGNDRIINDFGRKQTESPIGLVDIMDVTGAYLSRVAGTESGYFAAVRRLNTVLNYDAKANEQSYMTPADMIANSELERQSYEIRKMVIDRIGRHDFDRLNGRIRDIIEHRYEQDLRSGLAAKASRNIIGTLLGGSLKQGSANVTNAFSFLGYEHVTLPQYVAGLIKALANPARSWRIAQANPTIRNRKDNYRYSEYMEQNLTANDENFMTYLANYATKKDWGTVENLSDLVIRAGVVLKKVFQSPVVVGDFLGNVIGYAAVYDSAVKALGSEEAAQADLATFINERQSTSNQAVKGLMVRQANRAGWYGSLFAFTGEPTQKFGTISQDLNRMLSGDLSIAKGTKDITAQMLAMTSFAAVQAGLITGMAAAAAGLAPDDEEWERIYDNFFREIIGVMMGVAGPLSNAVAQPMANQIFFDSKSQSLSIPALSELTADTERLKKGELDDLVTRLISLSGIAVGLPRAYTSAKGVHRFASGDTQEKAAAKWQMEGRSEQYANYMAGIKSSRPKNWEWLTGDEAQGNSAKGRKNVGYTK